MIATEQLMHDSVRRALRWLVIVPAAYVSWHFCLVLGMVLLATAESFCPQDQKVSDLCVAAWFEWVEAIIFIFSAGLAAILIVASAAMIAPAYRVWVAWITFISGSLVAVYLGWITGGMKELIAAVIGGFVTLLMVIRWERRSLRK